MADTELDIALRPVAVELIADFGQTMTFYEETTTFSAATNDVTVGTATERVVKGAPIRGVTAAMRELDLIEDADVYTLVAAKDAIFTPITSMRCLAGGVNYQIIRIDEVRTGEQIGYWKIYLRK